MVDIFALHKIWTNAKFIIKFFISLFKKNIEKILMFCCCLKLTKIKIKQNNFQKTHLSLAMLEFLDIDFGDISKSESDRYKNDSLRCGKFCNTSPALGEPPSRGDRAPGPFSTSKLQIIRKKNVC